MEVVKRENKIEHEIGGIQNDTLRFGLNSVKCEIVGAHPLESAYQATKEEKERIRRRLLANTYGSTFPLKMDLDRQIFSRFIEEHFDVYVNRIQQPYVWVESWS